MTGWPESCPTCLQEVLGQLRKETAKVGKGGDEFVFAYVTALTAGLINRSCYDEEAWKAVGRKLLVFHVGMTKRSMSLVFAWQCLRSASRSEASRMLLNDMLPSQRCSHAWPCIA